MNNKWTVVYYKPISFFHNDVLFKYCVQKENETVEDMLEREGLSTSAIHILWGHPVEFVRSKR